MRFVADFHIHSKYSRATSKNMDLEHIDLGCRKKGIDIVTCADFTHPLWYKELRDKLTEMGKNNGLYILKPESRIKDKELSQGQQTQFILTTELSCIYQRGGQCRRIHLVIFAPNLDTVANINQTLGKRFNLRADGRPILGIDAEELTELLLKINPKIMIVPAHIWTPWFALFGSKSGFDNFEECFGQQTNNIFAIETGLSSDPAMNWRIPGIDTRTIISNSDAHSLDNLGREANVFEGKKISYNDIYDCLSHQGLGENLQLAHTIEFFPEEGKYHFDGHADCGIVLSPREAIKKKNICPECGRELTIGVAHRVEELAKRPEETDFSGRIPFKKIIPLREIIANAIATGKNSKTVAEVYEKTIKIGGDEFNVLLNLDLEKLNNVVDNDIIRSIDLARQGMIKIDPGYDGIYGKIAVDFKKNKPEQTKIF